MLLPVQQQRQVMGLITEICLPMVEKPKLTGPLLPFIQQLCLRESEDPSSPPSQPESPCLQLNARLHSPGLTPRGFSGHACSFLCAPLAPRPKLQGATSGHPIHHTDCTVYPPPLAWSCGKVALGQAILLPLWHFRLLPSPCLSGR